MLATWPYESEDLLENEEFESDESEQFDERAGRRGRQAVKTAKRGGAVPPRPAQGFATRAELTATANRLDARIGTNSSAIKAVEGRVNTISSDTTKLRADVGKLQSGINDVRNMSMLMPMLSAQKTVKTSTAVAGIPEGSNVVVDNGDTMSKILPLLMFSGGFGGSGSQSGSGGGMFGGDSSGMMMIAMIMAMDKSK